MGKSGGNQGTVAKEQGGYSIQEAMGEPPEVFVQEKNGI